MKTTLRAILVAAALGANGPAALATERTVALAVDNMVCPSCPYIVKKTLASVPGVSTVDVSFEQRIAIVHFDDAQTDVSALIDATAEVGFPSKLLGQGD